MPGLVTRDASDIPSGNHVEYVNSNNNSSDWSQFAKVLGNKAISFLKNDIVSAPINIYKSVITKPISKKVERKLNKFIRTHRLFWIWAQQTRLIQRQRKDNGRRKQIIQHRIAKIGSLILASQVEQKKNISFIRHCVKYYKQNKVIIEEKANEFYSESRKEVINEYIEMANNGISGVSETTKILFDYVYNSSGSLHIRNFINQCVLGDELTNSISNNGQMACQNFWNVTKNVVRQIFEPITRILSLAVNLLGSMPIPVRLNDVRRERNDLLLEDQNNNFVLLDDVGRERNDLLLEYQNDNDFIDTFHQTRDLRHRRSQRVNTGECNILNNDSPTSVMEVD